MAPLPRPVPPHRTPTSLYGPVPARPVRTVRDPPMTQYRRLIFVQIFPTIVDYEDIYDRWSQMAVAYSECIARSVATMPVASQYPPLVAPILRRPQSDTTLCLRPENVVHSMNQGLENCMSRNSMPSPQGRGRHEFRSAPYLDEQALEQCQRGAAAEGYSRLLGVYEWRQKVQESMRDMALVADKGRRNAERQCVQEIEMARDQAKGEKKMNEKKEEERMEDREAQDGGRRRCRKMVAEKAKATLRCVCKKLGFGTMRCHGERG